MRHIVEREIGGRTLSIETGLVAKQASGAVIVRYAGTAVLAAVTQAPPPPHLDFFPLTVDYREKTYAAGKIPGGFFKREGRPTTKEVLTSRLIDRPLRPLFPDGFKMDVAVDVMVISADRLNDPDVIAVIAASAALSISEVPWKGPIGAVRIGMIDGRLIVNPTNAERATGDLDLVVAGTQGAIAMVEAGANEVGEDLLLDALDEAQRVIRTVTGCIDDLVRVAGKPKLDFTPPARDEALYRRVWDLTADKVRLAMQTPGKMERKAAEKAVREELLAELCPPTEDPAQLATQPDPKVLKGFYETVKGEVERLFIIETSRRTDGRPLDGIRSISVHYGMLNAVHGSVLFTRGETQALVTATLGTKRDDQRIEGLHDEVSENFLLHYNFPAYCVGETWPNRGPKRREIGHGALAQRALRAVLPDRMSFPYTLRIVSEITESNGSSSMATVCGGSLALMDAGVQIRRPVAGIAMGLIKEGDRFAVLSDILGSEDHNGDMDFKVAGTDTGVTALQMDIKVDGLDRAIMKRALEQAREGRLHVLRAMLTELDRPRTEMHPLAPKVVRTSINPEKIGLVIGPGGKMIKKIQEETKTTIDIEDNGTVTIWGTTQAGADGALAKIEMLTEDVQVGRTYNGRIVSVKDFGAFVEVLPGQEGLLHVTELSDGFVENVAEHVRRGDDIRVKVVGIDPQGRIRLSHRAVLEDEGVAVRSERPENEGSGREERPQRDERGERSGSGDYRGDRPRGGSGHGGRGGPGGRGGHGGRSGGHGGGRPPRRD